MVFNSTFVADSFIGGGNQGTPEKTTNLSHNAASSTTYHEWGSNSVTSWRLKKETVLTCL